MKTNLLKKNNVSIEGNLDAKETILFAHGFGSDKTAWRHIKGAFADNYRLVLYDNVGAGKSDINVYSPLKYSTLNSYAEDLLDIVSELELKDTIVVAHSVSSMVSMLASLKDPDRFSKLIFIGASPRYLNDSPYIGGFEQTDLAAIYEAITANYYAWASGFAGLVMGNSEKPELAVEFAGTLSSIRPDIALSVLKVILESDLRESISKINKETLIVQSYEDAAVPLEVGDYLNKKIRNSKLLRVNATGHFPHISAPAAITEAINSFIYN